MSVDPLIGYSDFISREQFFIAWGADTHTHLEGLKITLNLVFHCTDEHKCG